MMVLLLLGYEMKIVLATRNPGKYEELAELLKVKDVEFVPISDFDLEDVEETGETLKENAILKARYAAKYTNLPAIADDSGLFIDALDGYPGIFSARCAGKEATDEEKRQHILKKMKGEENRNAKFMCCMALVSPEDLDYATTFTGTCYGRILEKAQGQARPRVQYDSIFFHYTSMLTLAQMSKKYKNEISHRGDAARQMKEYLENVFTRKCGDCLWYKGHICSFGVPNINAKSCACIEFVDRKVKNER
jgi:XTP/dITP diphosphohydrolase